MTYSDRRQLIKGGLAAGIGGLVRKRGHPPIAHPAVGRDPAVGAFGIQIIDEQTRRGIPLVELRTTNDVRYYTDSAGWAAVIDPGFMGQSVYFNISSLGYEHSKDGFGYSGFAADVKLGASVRIAMRRINIAQRLYRVTGEGIYEASIALGHTAPIAKPVLNADVMGQDSVQAVVYRGKIYWFWGDTVRASYPLGNFRTSGATSELPGHEGLAPQAGVNLNYFTDTSGFCRPMCPLPDEPSGVVWIDGLAVVPDRTGRMRMMAHYSRRRGLSHVYEHGLAAWDDQREIFEKYAVFPSQDHWRLPAGHPVTLIDHGQTYCLFNVPFPVVRVPALLEDAADPARYEAYTCLQPGTRFADRRTRLDRDSHGKVIWKWRRHTPPVSQAQETQLISFGLLHPHEARFQLADAANGQAVHMASGSCYYNAYLRQWLLIGCQEGGTSFLGEIWSAAATEATGPWTAAVKIATHPHYSFYNTTQHPFFDQHNGKIIYFDGTYSSTFSGNHHPTPRYNYNQLMYRLDLSDPRLQALRKT